MESRHFAFTSVGILYSWGRDEKLPRGSELAACSPSSSDCLPASGPRVG